MSLRKPLDTREMYAYKLDAQGAVALVAGLVTAHLPTAMALAKKHAAQNGKAVAVVATVEVRPLDVSNNLGAISPRLRKLIPKAVPVFVLKSDKKRSMYKPLLRYTLTDMEVAMGLEELMEVESQ